MNDDDSLSDAPLSPLSTALDSAALETKTRATNGNSASFVSETSESSQFVTSGSKTYLCVDHTANRRQGAPDSWIWDHGDELRHIVGDKAQKNWRYKLCKTPNTIIIPITSTTFHASDHLRKKHHVYKPGTEPKTRRGIGQLASAYQALVSTVQADRFRYLLIC
jgi:hypothetical protein